MSSFNLDFTLAASATRTLLCLCLGLATLLAVLPLSAAAQSEDTMRDKTLVVWAAPANLEQRGGSALTIEDRSNHFDGIVFGELAPGKWMAGSDTYSRTLQDQGTVEAETAAPGAFVQIAIVYHGSEVTLYRNGREISRYPMPSAPRAFRMNSLALFGKRHRAQADNAHFAGEIADARIYDRALTGEQIAALRLKQPSEIKPWAWWTFEDPAGADTTGRFPIGQLSGGAKIEGGKLMLDGKEATLLCTTGKDPAFVPETPAMPPHPPATWLTFHLAHPGPDVAIPGDPNCAFYWKGKYHLHYIYNNKDGFSFAHVSSDDMVHWKWHPTVLTPPNTGHGMFSGTGFFTREGKPAIIYHGQGSGRNQVAIALDDDLDKWTKPVPVEPIIRPGQDGSLIANWDPDAWLEGDRYYALSGGIPGSGKPATVFRSTDLKHWDYLGLFLAHDMPDVQHDEDISCPNFFKIGNKRMLLCISHNKGCRYYLGEWKDEKFIPEEHHRMNWNGWDFFAPESLLTPDGRRVMWAWCRLGDDLPTQSGIQSLPRELSLPKDGVLRIKPLRELEQLRADEVARHNLPIHASAPTLLNGIAGDALELKIVIHPGVAQRFGAQVYADAAGNGGFPILVDRADGTLSVGGTKAPFTLHNGEELTLRVFLDKSMVEVFANDRQAVVAAHRYAPQDLAVSLVSTGGDCMAKDVRAWRMKSIYTNQ
jgi:beta-fructofuranosidase